ncbi:MAG: CooT family nickel-binding protein [Thermoflexales bacterium]|nr:CooT family nickel-binding protein [Thermoflexales bacterium]
MCLATAYIKGDDGQREQVMQDVAWIELIEGGVQLTALLGESQLFQAQIESIDLLKSAIVLKRVTADSRPQEAGGKRPRLNPDLGVP